MLTLVFMRHGQCMAPPLRKLTPEGIEGLQATGAKLRAMGIVPDVILSSRDAPAPASAAVLAEALGVGADKVESNAMFDSGDVVAFVERLPQFIQGMKDDFKTVAIITHGPEVGATTILSRRALDRAPDYADAVVIKFETDHWSGVSKNSGSLAMVP